MHYGDLTRVVLPAAAPLAISTCTATGMTLTMQLRKEFRIAFSVISEGGSSLREWHEAINLAAAKKLPIIYTIENKQTTLTTTTEQQTKVCLFGEKAVINIIKKS